MEACLEALLVMNFCTKPPNFGVEAHMEAPAGDALICANLEMHAMFRSANLHRGIVYLYSKSVAKVHISVQRIYDFS
jgi:hypothetical protein